MNTSCMHQSGMKQNGPCQSCSRFPLNFIGCCLDNHLLCQGPGTFFPPQYCLLFSSFSHPGSSEILGSPGIVSSPCVTLGTGAKHSWRKLAPFLTGMLVCDLLSISSASVISLLGLYASTKSPPPCHSVEFI